MTYFTQHKIALGLITRRLQDPEPILDFLRNARQHGHRIDRFIIAYSHDVDAEIVQTLRAEVRVDVIRAYDDQNLQDRLLAAGLRGEEVEGLLEVPDWLCYNEVSYGAYRNAVLVQALLSGMDYLLFFDTDIQPRVLTSYVSRQSSWQEVDFVGRHLEHLTRPDVSATSSDYSGYYIIPAMAFEGLDDLLIGVGKEAALDYLVGYKEHGCLKLGPPQPGSAVPTEKVLGGNLGLSLDTPRRLAPFFSTTYPMGKQCVLGRGEDTLLGPTILNANGLVLDIDLQLFHDTYGDFPTVPDIRRKKVHDRFYRACLGWIGRNPFLLWFQDQLGQLDESYETKMTHQRERLIMGASKAARFLDDARFENLPIALDISMNKLPEMIARYERLVVGWSALVNWLSLETISDQAIEAESDQLQSAL